MGVFDLKLLRSKSLCIYITSLYPTVISRDIFMTTFSVDEDEGDKDRRRAEDVRCGD